jgi:hypothetical protein
MNSERIAFRIICAESFQDARCSLFTASCLIVSGSFNSVGIGFSAILTSAGGGIPRGWLSIGQYLYYSGFWVFGAFSLNFRYP